MPDRTALSMEIALGVAISQHPTGIFLTATADRGEEFACYASWETAHKREYERVTARVSPLRYLSRSSRG